MSEASPADSVMLIDSAQPGIHITLSAAISDEGLTLSGHDVGSRVEEIWGDVDYEYWLRVAEADCVEILDPLRADLAAHPGCGEPLGGSLLGLLRVAFRCGRFTSTSDFRAWLDEHDIPSRFNSYA
jgi:hypothetical protein